MRFVLCVLIASLTFFVGCGKAAPDFAEPADGQTFDLNSPSLQVRVTLANNEYEGVAIEFRGLGALTNEIRCDNVSNSPYTQCYRATANGSTYGGSSCTPQAPCEVVIVARNEAGLTALRTIRFQRGMGK